MACCPTEPTGPDRPLLLLIEDEPGLPEVLGTALRSRGLEVSHASGSAESVAGTASASADLVVLEVSLHNGHGFRVLERLQRHDIVAGLPLIVYTHRELDNLDRGRLQLGPTTYLTKSTTGPRDLEAHLLELLDEAG